MIVVKVSTDPSGKCLLRFEIPDNGKTFIEYGTANSPSEARRIMYFKLRRFIFQKLHSWIVQRKHAIIPFHQMDDYADKLSAVEILLVKLQYYQQASFWTLSDMIADNAHRFLLLAPAEKSKMYPYFKNTIQPILQFCTDNKVN